MFRDLPWRCVVAWVVTLTVCWSGLAGADTIERTDRHAVRVRILTRGLERPWSLAFLPDGRMLVTERAGRLRYVAADGTLDPTPVSGLPAAVTERRQGGLHDVVLHPDFSRNRLVYLAYAGRGDGGYGTELARGRLDGHRLTGVKILFRALPKSFGGRHFGGRVVFDGKGHVFLTLGDRGNRPSAQDFGNHAGSVIRLTEDGGVPQDNPFRSVAGARPEIYTLGNRNIQGAAIHPRTGELWTHEHGPQGGDEVNIIRAGVNYGWPVITYGRNYGIGTRIGEGTHKEGMAQPLYQWTPSIAPSGMAFYDGDKFPGWRGNLLVGALRFRLLSRLELDGERVVREERILERTIGRIRDVRVGPDGYVYLLSDETSGVIARLEPAGG
ncbi:MAG: PQQ-dependent sugar dehydrogenase [Deltaproteobacteria bacterium]|nr:PQQ-dependent sugar dehydrogenase [Deltaproteobacteria bacterium]